MSLSTILDFFKSLAPALEPMLVSLDNNTVQPELKKLIDGVSSPDLKLFLQTLDGAIDSFIQAELQKLSPPPPPAA